MAVTSPARDSEVERLLQIAANKPRTEKRWSGTVPGQRFSFFKKTACRSTALRLAPWRR
jgi:hypothetical protein